MHERSFASSPYSDLVLYLPLFLCVGLFIFGLATSVKSTLVFDSFAFALAAYPIAHLILQRKLFPKPNPRPLFRKEYDDTNRQALLIDRFTDFIQILASHFHFFAALTLTILLVAILQLHGLHAFAIVYFALALFGSFTTTGITALLVAWFLLMLVGRTLILPSILTADHMAVPKNLTWTYILPEALGGIIFASFGTLIHGAERLERRIRHLKEIKKERDDMLQQAKEFRLLSPRRTETKVDRDTVSELLAVDAAKAVNHSIYVTLEMTKRALNAHTVVLLWLNTTKDLMRIKELVSSSDNIQTQPIRPERGIIGGIYRRRDVVRLVDIHSNRKGLTYYSKPENVSSFIGIPVMEEGNLYGILCADRLENTPFSEEDGALLRRCAETILRSATNERLYLNLEKSKSELSRLFEASRRLNSTLTPKQVYEVAAQSINDIFPYDFYAITTYDPVTKRHHVAYTDDRMNTQRDWLGIDFEDNSRLVSMVVKNMHVLPYGGNVRTKPAIIFTDDTPLHDVESLLILPLVAHDEAIGTLIVASKRPKLFDKDKREILGFIAAQVAIPLQNARLYEKMETMATTDGLTGLPNHRTFQQRLTETIARASRKKETFCLLLTDIDHFKTVNDTYGHPVGDEVLRRLSRVFRDNLREIDIPARYGGEEFAVILDNTGLEGAMMIANRLREALKAEVFHTPQGDFSRTMSIGIACWPSHGQEKQTLIDHADQALYYSKENGRDRATDYGTVAAAAAAAT